MLNYIWLCLIYLMGRIICSTDWVFLPAPDLLTGELVSTGQRAGGKNRIWTCPNHSEGESLDMGGWGEKRDSEGQRDSRGRAPAVPVHSASLVKRASSPNTLRELHIGLHWIGPLANTVFGALAQV